MSDNQDDFNEDQILSYTHGIRKKVVNSIMEDGKVPKDTKEIAVLAGVLSDMDRAALTSKRIKTDDKNSQAHAGAAGLIAKLLSSINVKNAQTDPLSIDNGYVPPEIPDNVQLPSVASSELGQGTSTTTYEDFAKEHFTIDPTK